jgi:hypothetical protein
MNSILRSVPVLDPSVNIGTKQAFGPFGIGVALRQTSANPTRIAHRLQ